MADEASPASDVRRIGRYRVTDTLGEGGMGSVFLGIDDRLRRRVALKLVRSDRRLDPLRKARFLREARVLARLDHPNVCQFHDYIEGDDEDCLVLELVEGRSLREAMDDGIDEPTRLDIAAQLLDVLAAVHGQGVIHRDLKPENIMLTPDGVIKVLDFGLARPVADPESLSGQFVAVRDEAPGDEHPGESMTSFGTVLGTVGYMSPEVARGEPATAASDLYSAGLIIRELVTGRRPIPDDLPPAERHRRAMWAELEPVEGIDSALAELIRRLESLVPQSRPSAIDAAAMLGAIRDRPRLRRRRILMAGVVALLAIFGIAMTFQFLRAENEKRRAEAEAATAREVSGFLTGLFDQASPRVTQGDEITVGELLERGVETIGETLAEQPELRARMLYTLANVYYELARYAESDTLLDEALTIRREHLTGDHPELIETLRLKGVVAGLAGRYSEAESLYLEALDRLEPPTDAGEEALVARLLIDYSGIFQQRGQWADAEEPLLRAVEMLDEHPDRMLFGLTDAIFELATIYRKLGRLERAEETIERCLELDTAEFGRRSHQVAGDLAELGAVAALLGEDERAERLARESLEIRIQIYGGTHPDVGHSATTLGVAQRRLGRLDAARASFEMALDVYRNALGPEHPYVGSVLHSIGMIGALEGDLDEAAALLEESIRITSASKGEDHPLVAESVEKLGWIRQMQGRHAEAAELYERALAVLEEAYSDDHAIVVETLEGYAECLRALGLDTEAARVEARVRPRSG